MDNPEFTVFENKKEYKILWAIFKDGSDVCRQHNISGDISLPFFLTGKDLVDSEKGEGFVVDDIQLIIGLLLRHKATPPMTVTHKITPYFDSVLKDTLTKLIN